jgi:hypothetical protein
MKTGTGGALCAIKYPAPELSKTLLVSSKPYPAEDE